MADFPAAVPTFTDLDPNATLKSQNHGARHNKVHTEVAAIATKVGADASVNQDSHDYKLSLVTGANKAETIGNKDTDVSLTANSDTKYASQKATKTYVDSEISALGATLTSAISVAVAATKEALFPIGSHYVNFTDSTNPGTLLGFGTWVAVEGMAVVGVKTGDSDFGTPGAKPGAKSHFHWQTIGSDAGTGFVETAGSGSGQSRVVTTFRQTFAVAGNSVAGIREDGTYTASSIQPSVVSYMWQRTA